MYWSAMYELWAVAALHRKAVSYTGLEVDGC